MDACVTDLDPHLQAHRLVRVAVVVDESLGLIDAEWQRGDFGPRAPLGVGEELFHGGENRAEPVPGNERLDPTHPRRIRSDLGAEVACRLVLRADLRQDQLEDVRDDLARLDDLHRRDDHPLLKDLSERANARWSTPTDVDMMRDVRDVAEQVVPDVDRGDQTDVVQVDPARMRVVRDDDIPGPEVFWAVAPHRLRHLLDHRAEVDRLRESLSDRP